MMAKVINIKTKQGDSRCMVCILEISGLSHIWDIIVTQAAHVSPQSLLVNGR
jgi:hypothetical protein